MDFLELDRLLDDLLLDPQGVGLKMLDLPDPLPLDDVQGRARVHKERIAPTTATWRSR